MALEEKAPEEKIKKIDLAVIGGGPAGLTAAIYAARRGLRATLFEGKAVGGAMAITHLIENYPGYKSISGVELAQKMREQVEALGVEIVEESVSDIKRESAGGGTGDDSGAGGGFALITESGKSVSAGAVILATGSAYKQLQAPGEKEFVGRGVSYCATCDAPFFKGMRVAVIGGGNTALNNALLLSDIAQKVFLINRRSELRGEELLVQRLRDKGVEFLLGWVVKEIRGDKFVRELVLKNVESGENVEGREEKTLAVDGVFIAVGMTPITSLAKSLGVELDEKGFVRVDERQRTSVPGVFAAGDCVGRLMQIVEACAEGAIAALSAFNYLKKK